MRTTRTTGAGGRRVERIGLWALVAAVVVHGVLLLGLRVPREAGGRWLGRRTLIWETQARRWRAGGAHAERIAGIHRMIARETPPVEVFSKSVMLLAQRTPAMPVVASVLTMPGVLESERPQTESMRKGHALVWQMAAEGELGEAVLRAWNQRGAQRGTTNYAPRTPVMLEVRARGNGVPESVRILQGSGDAAFDEAARAMVGGLRLMMGRRGRPDGKEETEVRRARVIVTIEPED